MSREAKVLRTEILEARREIDRLSSKLLQLEERLTELEDQGGFELVSSAEETVNKEDTKAREEIAKSCGNFFRRALQGQPRGTSGRDRLQLQNRGYVVLADHSGRRLPEPLFTVLCRSARALQARSGPWRLNLLGLCFKVGSSSCPADG